MSLANVNSPTAKIAATTSSASILVNSGQTPNLNIFNSGTVPVAVKTGVSGVTVTFPTGAAVECSVILPGGSCSFSKAHEHTHVAVVTASSTADVFIQFSSGE